MTLLICTAAVGKNYHGADGTKPRAEREYTAQAATALSIHSPLAPSWTGFLKLPGGGLAVNDNFLAKMKATRLGFTIEGEGGGR